MDRETAAAHVDAWIEAWNAHDLEGILSCYSDEIVFTAQTVVVRWNVPDGTLRGKDELRKHFAAGLELVPDIRFTSRSLLLAPNGYTLIYERENGNLVAEATELDDNGKTVRATAYYESAQA